MDRSAPEMSCGQKSDSTESCEYSSMSSHKIERVISPAMVSA